MPFAIRLLSCTDSLCIPFFNVRAACVRVVGQLDMYVSTGQFRGKTIDTGLQSSDGCNDLVPLLDGSSTDA